MVKKLHRSGMLAATALAVAMLTVPAASAQQTPAIPLDPAVVTGTLPNGMTYIVRHNEYPKGQAEFFIAQKVGSILEEDNQRGLAHFLEHVAFEGSTNYPDGALDPWMKSKGINSNAYTSYDQTVYYLSGVPVAKQPSLVDSCLLVLKDWACGIDMKPEKIEQERNVIHEEWRMRNVGMYRLFVEGLAKVLPDSARYGQRSPIGTMDVVLNFKPRELADYYAKWYRPDQQGIIVVGDVNVDSTVNMIKEMFGPIPAAVNPAERRYFTWGDTEGTRVAVGSDAEVGTPMTEVVIAYDAMPMAERGSMMKFSYDYLLDMVCRMLNTRLEDISNKPDATFGNARLDAGPAFGIAAKKDALTLDVMGKDGKMLPGLRDAYRELRRALTGGFTQSELDRAKAEWIKELTDANANRSKHHSNDYAGQYVDYFLEGRYTPDEPTRLQLGQMLTAIPVSELNKTLAGFTGKDNRLVLAMLPKRDDVEVPTEQQILDLLAEVDAETLEPYKDEMRTDPLVPVAPTPGSVTSVTPLAAQGAAEWTLSNGAKVIVKPTTLKDDEIIVKAVARGGYAKMDFLSDATASTLGTFAESIAPGSYSVSDLGKYLAGKNVDLSFSLTPVSRTIDGSTNVSDLPTLLEVMYGYMTAPAVDGDVYESIRVQYPAMIKGSLNRPELRIEQLKGEEFYGSPRMESLNPDNYAKADSAELLKAVQQMVANAADYTFIFTGNVDEATLRPLVEKYVASLPADVTVTDTEVVNLPAYCIRPGKGEGSATMKMETPQVYHSLLISANMPVSLRTHLTTLLLRKLIYERLFETVRVKMGATYGSQPNAGMRTLTTPSVQLSIDTTLKPEAADKAIEAIDSIAVSLGEGITPQEFANAKETVELSIKRALETNQYFAQGLSSLALAGVDTSLDPLATLNEITAADVEAFVRELLAAGNRRSAVLRPE
ncbi:MAG: insulinase family protein [Candidatus Amulumruptor caecigallinarius]|nr:insulinase family protein [Candidatus Amulumruptor caecigallinarius]MCM1397648.1 insulinase family protein [Candidatus Amulumruptor caecigallinarius]MCM1454672.1 insulinase family protein [bacterium]